MGIETRVGFCEVAEDTLRDLLELAENRRHMFVPASHFYSPIVNQDFITPRRALLYDGPDNPVGIDLNEAKQLAFLPEISLSAASLPFEEQRQAGLRYHYDNGAFLHGDAMVYAAMIQHYRPGQIVETGIGFSSALAADVIDLIPGYNPKIRLIDPNPDLAAGLIGDLGSRDITFLADHVQDLDPSMFDDLEAGDIYFMDTTHVVKTGSDVLYHFEKVLPRLKPGVIIHVHDIFFPFEYPESWVFDLKLSWNELYYFRAFMTNNEAYEILFFNSFMRHAHLGETLKASPLFISNGGCSIWLRKR